MSNTSGFRRDVKSRHWQAALAVSLCALALASGCKWNAAGKNVSGTALYQQGRYPEAVAKFQEALTADPRNADAYYNLGGAYAAMGKLNNDPKSIQQAEQLYNQCLDISPDHADCHRALACLLVEQGRSDSAFTLMERWAQRSPQNADAQIEVARLYQEFGDKQSATRYLEQAVAVDTHNPRNARAWAALASLREQNGDTYQALMDYSRAQQLNPYQPAVTERIAALQRSMGGTTPQLATPATPTTPGTRSALVPTAPPRY